MSSITAIGVYLGSTDDFIRLAIESIRIRDELVSVASLSEIDLEYVSNMLDDTYYSNQFKPEDYILHPGFSFSKNSFVTSNDLPIVEFEGNFYVDVSSHMEKETITYNMKSSLFPSAEITQLNEWQQLLLQKRIISEQYPLCIFEISL